MSSILSNELDSEQASAARSAASRKARFRYWQRRTLIASMAGYAAFYFVRKNLSVAMPAMQDDLGISKGDLGLFLTLHGLLYGVSKFVNGMLGDRVNARIFMVIGLCLSAAANVAFGSSSTVILLGLFWMLNGWVQGMGFPPCARLMTHWFPPEQLATKMSIWNTSHSIGASLIVIFCGYIVAYGWRWCFYAPAIIVSIGAIILWLALRDTPRSVGLPEIGSSDSESDSSQESETVSAGLRKILRKHVFGNPYIWLLAIANFFVYTLRYAMLDWGPTLLKEWKGVPLSHAGWIVATFEIAGIVGMLAAGWATDRVFGGRAARMCLICMIFAASALVPFWLLDSPPVWLATLLLGVGGFFIYGPQALVGIAAANLATRRAAATAVGFTGLFGYLSTILSGWGLGVVAETFGWHSAFGALMVVAALGITVFALAWPARAHGYDTCPENR